MHSSLNFDVVCIIKMLANIKPKLKTLKFIIGKRIDAKICCLFKCPALPLPLVQIPDPQALPKVKFPTPEKGLLSIARWLPVGKMLKVRVDRCITTTTE